MKTLLKNGKIYDGTGSEPFMGEILFEDGKILKVAEKVEDAADRVIDLQGRSISSGFIDIHSHNDWFVIKKNFMPYFEPFIRQGITSFVAGNCGLSAVGFEEDTPYLEKIGGGLFGYRGDIRGVYPDTASLLKAIDESSPCNMAVLAGHCSARAGLLGYDSRQLTPEEEKKMLDILEKNLQQGAAGISFGLMYEPGLYASLEELKKVSDLCVKYNKILTVHPRAESKVSLGYKELFGRSHLLRAFDELKDMAKGTDLKLQYSHAIFVGRKSFKDKEELMKMIGEMRKEGVRVQFDIYNETKGVSVITVATPAWYQAMTEEERKKPLTKLKLAAMIKATSFLIGFTYDDIEVAYIGPGYEAYEGKTVHQLAKEHGMKDMDMYLQLCRESNFTGRVNMGPYTNEDIIHDFENNELCLYMTDAWVEEHGIQNPAIYDCFPKFLQDSLNGLGDTMPHTVRRMTGAGADRFMLKDRGYVKEGYFADFTVFDEDELKTTEPDHEKSFGIHKVFVNGNLILDEGKIDAELAQHSGMAMPVM